MKAVAVGVVIVVIPAEHRARRADHRPQVAQRHGDARTATGDAVTLHHRAAAIHTDQAADVPLALDAPVRHRVVDGRCILALPHQAAYVAFAADITSCEDVLYPPCRRVQSDQAADKEQSFDVTGGETAGDAPCVRPNQAAHSATSTRATHHSRGKAVVDRALVAADQSAGAFPAGDGAADEAVLYRALVAANQGAGAFPAGDRPADEAVVDGASQVVRHQRGGGVAWPRIDTPTRPRFLISPSR